MATNEEKARQRDRLRHRCPSCENQVSAEDDVCPACGTERPARGWVRVTELVVHAGLDRPAAPSVPTIQGSPPVLSAPPPRPPVHRTVYLEAPGQAAPTAPEGHHTVGLVATFFSSAALTFGLVLAVYWGRRSEEPPPPMPAPSAETQAGVRPAPEPPRDPSPSNNSPSDSSPSEAFPDDPYATSSANLGAPQATRSASGTELGRTTGLARSPSPTRAAAPTPAPRARVAAPAPRAKPLSPRMIRFNGDYVGTIDGAPVTFTLWFLEGGVVEANIDQKGGALVRALGSYRMLGSSARIELQDAPSDESASATMSAYTGEINERGLKGHVTLSTGDVSYFMATR